MVNRAPQVLVLVAATALPALVIASCGRPAPASYAEDLAADRTTKDRLFQSAADSPVPAERRADLLPLAYFPADESFVVPASLEPSSGMEPAIEMPTSTGQQRQMRRVGLLRFTLRGQPLRLSAFVEAAASDLNRLFVPFADQTTGKETYSAGRYLDLERTATGIYSIDFNRAYQPYCAYNSAYDCPYPPPENRLAVAVKAGEKFRGQER